MYIYLYVYTQMLPSYIYIHDNHLLGERDAVEDGPVVGRQGQEQPAVEGCVYVLDVDGYVNIIIVKTRFHGMVGRLAGRMRCAYILNNK